MDLKLFFGFVGLAVAFALLLSYPLLMINKRISQKDYSAVEDVTEAVLIDSGTKYSDDKSRVLHVWGEYEWRYNGKKHRMTIKRNKGRFEEKMNITVNRITGDYKLKEAERRAYLMDVIILLIVVFLSYVLAVRFFS